MRRLASIYALAFLMVVGVLVIGEPQWGIWDPHDQATSGQVFVIGHVLLIASAVGLAIIVAMEGRDG